MALSQKSKQKKDAKKRAKRQKQLSNKQSKPKLSNAELLDIQMNKAEEQDIYKCIISHDLFDNGFGTAIFARQFSTTGEVAASGFILDLDHQGVKESFFSVVSKDDFDKAVLAQEEKIGKLVDKEPAAFKKLVHEAAAFGLKNDCPPHNQYSTAIRLFENIDNSNCDEKFDFGNYQSKQKNDKKMESILKRKDIIPKLRGHFGAVG
jgi:hypothetical protein